MVVLPSPCWGRDSPLEAATCHPKTGLLRGRGGLATAPPTPRAACLSQWTVLQGSGMENWRVGTATGGQEGPPARPLTAGGFGTVTLPLSS